MDLTYLYFIIAIALGGVVGFFIASFLKNTEISTKNVELNIQKKALEDRSRDLEQLEVRFKAVAGDVMRTQSQDFLLEFERRSKLHSQSVEEKEKGFGKIAESVNQSIESVGKKINEFEQQRGQQFGALGEGIKNLLNTSIKMQETAKSLKDVLSSSGAIIGSWGEAVLKNILGEAGLTEGIDFHIQETISGDENKLLRPDVIVNLPGGLQLAIDSKAAVMDEYLKAYEEKDQEKREEHINKFTQQIKEKIKALSGKEYQKHVDGRIPYVVMFVPNESAMRAVFDRDVNLYREAQSKHVMLASPVTIMPLILIIAHAWKQQKSAENASKITEEVGELGARIKKFMEHIGGMRESIMKTTKKFDEATGSWNTRVSPKIETIKNLGGRLQIESEIQVIEESSSLLEKLDKSKSEDLSVSSIDE